MKLKRTLRVGAIAAWALAIAPMLPTFGSADSGATLDAQGWWNKTQALPVQGDPTGLGLTTVPTVPAPATVPADGLSVANDSSGPTAIAAVRYLLGGQGGGTLRLDLVSGSTLTGTEQLTACPVQGGFTPAQNGRWASAPAYEPEACVVVGAPNAEATAFTFEIPSTFASALGNDVTVLIAPQSGSATPFSLSFTKPADDAFTVTTAVQSPQPSPSPPAYEPGSAVYTPPAASGSFAPPATPTVPTTVAPAQTGDEVAAGVPATLPASSTEEGSRTAQYAAVAMLLAIGAAFWWLASQPQRIPRLLGSVGGANQQPGALVTVPVTARAGRARGVGRFARHRDAPATPI